MVTKIVSGRPAGRPTHRFQKPRDAYNAVRLAEGHIRTTLAACERMFDAGMLNDECDFSANHVNEFIDAAHHFLETLNAEPWQLLGREDKG
jgi:hypothetical protein